MVNTVDFLSHLFSLTSSLKPQQQKSQVNPKYDSRLLPFFWCNSCSSAIIFFLVMFLSSNLANLTSFDKIWSSNFSIFIKFVLFNSFALWRSSIKLLICFNNPGMISIDLSHIGGSHHTKNLHPLPLCKILNTK